MELIPLQPRSRESVAVILAAGYSSAATKRISQLAAQPDLTNQEWRTHLDWAVQYYKSSRAQLDDVLARFAATMTRAELANRASNQRSA